MFALGQNIGYDFAGVVSAHKSDIKFPEKQKEAWDMVRKSIDEGIPCYGWELETAEFYVINGYDDIGYYYSGGGADPIKGPKPWQELGESDIGLVEMYSIKPGQPADDATTVKEALEFALEHARGPEKWIFPNYKAGLAGFDKWIETVQKGEAMGVGMAYNAAVWAECRAQGLQFLREARQRLDGSMSPLLEEAIESYSPVIESLSKLVDLFPFPPDGEIEDRERIKKALEHLKRAREAEEKGLKSLEKIVAAL
jgi:hypothetical protein